MTIKTLTYIHKLLTDDALTKEYVYRSARNLQHEYEEHENTKLAAEQKEAADHFYEDYLKASYALEDFEAQEW